MDANTIELLKPSPLKRLVADENAFKENSANENDIIPPVETRFIPLPLKDCLYRLVNETNACDFYYLDANEVVQAAYMLYIKDGDWGEFKDTCTRVLASLRRTIKGIKGCLDQLALETNDHGFSILYNHDAVQAAYELYTEDADWEEWKDTCTRVLASLRRIGIVVL